MVNIDTVYQRVLALANKEQRGYITPQEFNLFANQAQMDIFEQYFYDINNINKLPGNNTEFSNHMDILNEKISIFERQRGSTWMQTNLGTTMVIPKEVYRIGTIRIDTNQVEMMSSKDFDQARLSRLTSPSPSRPIGYMIDKRLYIATASDTFETASSVNMNMSYIRRPADVAWGYVVVGGNAMFDPTNTTHFELHGSEEGELVNRILMFAGITLMNQQISQPAAAMEQMRLQNELNRG